MPRFILNRRWTFILVLASGIAIAMWPARPSFADPVDGGGRGTGDNGGGDIIPPPNPQGAGDPDSPSGSGKSAPSYVGGQTGKGMIGPLGVHGVGDAAAMQRMRMWMQVRYAMGVLKYFYLRF